MCGICGEIDFYNKSVKPELIQRMCNLLEHRGPDDAGMLFLTGNKYFEVSKINESPMDNNGFQVGLGHRRLSIIDLSATAHQPMCNEDATVWIVFNGEIYNFQDLRMELERKGHLFKSRS
ncbi:MAG: hypothetical protein ABSH06_16690, partial [Thermodesulfobacteriota bacterium]